MKFERRLHNGKWAAYVRVLGIWWFIRDFDNAKKAGHFVSIAMGQNILRPRKEKKVLFFYYICFLLTYYLSLE